MFLYYLEHVPKAFCDHYTMGNATGGFWRQPWSIRWARPLTRDEETMGPSGRGNRVSAPLAIGSSFLAAAPCAQSFAPAEHHGWFSKQTILYVTLPVISIEEQAWRVQGEVVCCSLFNCLRSMSMQLLTWYCIASKGGIWTVNLISRKNC